MSRDNGIDDVIDFDDPVDLKTTDSIAVVSDSVYELTEEQKEAIDEYVAESDNPTLLGAIRHIYTEEIDSDGKKIDGRHLKGKLVNNYLATKGKKVKTSRHEKLGDIDLQDHQKEFIIKHHQLIPSFVKVAQMLFQDDTLTNWSREAKTVQNFIAEYIKGQTLAGVTPTEQAKEYRGPKNILETISRLKKYVNVDWHHESLNKKTTQQLEALKEYLNSYRFKRQIQVFKKQADRDSFEDSFIRYTYDKPDLTQEERDQFITLCVEVVLGLDIQNRKAKLNEMLESISDDSEGKKISMGLNDAINNLEQEHNACNTRSNKLYQILTGARVTRLEEKIKENSSMINLVTAWKQKEKRDGMIKYAEMLKVSTKKEAENMISVDQTKALMAGLDLDTALHG